MPFGADTPRALSASAPISFLSHARWLPAALLVSMLVLSLLSGRGVVREAPAATIDITGSVASDIYLDATNCTASAVAIGDLVPGTDPWKTAQDQGGQACAIDFGTTNHTAGTTLSMLEDPSAPASPADAMKCVGGGCTGDSIADYENGSEPSAGTSAFGAQLLSATAPATGVWSAGPAVYDVQDTASPACTTATTGTGTCAFTWGATASTADQSGSFQAQARFVVLGN
jgi:hypothetical protein